MDDKARQHVLAIFIIILLVLCVFSSFYNFPIQQVSSTSSTHTVYSGSSVATYYPCQRKLVRQSNGTLWCTFYENFDVHVAYSTDDGETWNDIEVYGDASSNYPTIAVDSKDVVHLVFSSYKNDADDWQLEYSNSSSNWVTIVQIRDEDKLHEFPALAIDSNDNLHIVYQKGEEGSSNDMQVAYINSTNNGGSWGTEQILTDEPDEDDDAWYPSIAIDNNDVLHIVFRCKDHYSGYDDILHMQSSDDGDTWSRWDVDPVYQDGSHDQMRPCITIDDNDKLHVVWVGDSQNVNDQIGYSHNDSSGWSVVEWITWDPAKDYHYPSVSVNDNDYIHSVFDVIGTRLNHSVNDTSSWTIDIALVGDYGVPNMISTQHPTINGVKTNRPKTGYALICSYGTSNITFHASADLIWDSVDATGIHSMPRINPSGIIDIGNTTANATMTITNGYNCSYGVWYGTTFPVNEENADGNISGADEEYNQSSGTLTASITGLTPSQLYYTTAWVSNPSGKYNSSYYNFSFDNYSYTTNGSGWHNLTFPTSIWENNQQVDDSKDVSDNIVIETFLQIGGVLDDVDWIFRVSDGKNWNKGAGGNTLTSLTYDEEYYFHFLNATNISFVFNSGANYDYYITFPQELFDYNSSINANNTCENFCQQGGIYDDVDWIFRVSDGKNWNKGAGGNTLTSLTYDEEYLFYMLNYTTNLSFIYDNASINSTFLTRPNPPTNLNINFNTTRAVLTWDKNSSANRTIVTIKTITPPTNPNDGTIIYNGTGEIYTDSYEDYTSRFYRAWSYTNWTYNPTLWQFSSGYSQANTTYTIDPPSDRQSSYDYPYLNLTWSRGDRSIQEIVVSRNDTWSTSAIQSGNWIRQNSTNTWFNASETQMRYYTIWSYNLTDNIYSSIGLNIPWGGLTLNCYDEETNGSLWFDVSISNQDGSQTYESRNNSNPLILDILQLPIGDDIKITVSAASNYSEKSEVSYWGIDENQTITYIVLSQTSDSKSNTNVTCINISDDAHSYPPFTLDGDLITILPDNADNFTKIIVNYTHEEYGSRLYYRDIGVNIFGVLNTYLPPSDDKQLYLLEVIDQYDQSLEDAYIEVKRSVNGTFVAVSRLLTDANGQADIYLMEFSNYIFIISKDGYVTENASWTPGDLIFTHTFKLRLESDVDVPPEFGEIISLRGVISENNTLTVTFYDKDNAMLNSHFYVEEYYNQTFTYMGEYNGTTSNSFTFTVDIVNYSRMHVVRLYMNHSNLGETVNYTIYVMPVAEERDEGNWLENLIRSVVGDFDYGYVVTIIWVMPCILLLAGFGSMHQPGIGILGAGMWSGWFTSYLIMPNEADILVFAGIALIVAFLVIVLKQGKKVVHE